ncbi:MAG TPA: hypothetical protein VE685_18035 [Thermoanaerobaculia bacterium]|nr:hypothetical protein [Thermoanaerobaculia bacterium]
MFMTPDRFFELVRRELGFLIQELGFVVYQEAVFPPECWIELRNETTGVTVTYEVESAPWVKVARLGSYEGKIVDLEGYDLLFLLKARSPSAYRELMSLMNEKRDIAEILQKAALNLRLYATDVLTGDFSVFQSLEPIAAKRLKARESKLFGR